MAQRKEYPPHTLAPDPLQGGLDLRPPLDQERLPKSKQDTRVLCHFCGCIHHNQQEVLECKAGN